MPTFRCTALFCLTFAGSLALMQSAHAGGFLVRSHSAAGFGTSLAGVAAGDQLSYSYWNPAVLSHVQGFEIEADAALILPSIDIDPDTGSSVDIGEIALVPSTFVGVRLTEDIVMGLAISSPFGLSTEAPDDWAGQIYSRSSEMFSININPMLSYRFSDYFAVGAGIQAQYFSADLTSAYPLAPASDVELDASDVGFGFNLGFQLTPWQGTDIGVGFRSSIRHDVDGDFVVAGTAIPAGTTLDTPEVVSVGINQAVTDRFRALGTVEWSNWSRLGDLAVVDNSGSTLTTLYLRYNDGWLFSLGGEYDVSDRLTLRAGLGYEISPLDDDNRDTRFPETDQFMVSAGLSYKYSDYTTLSASYLYSMGLGDGDISIDASDPGYLGAPFSGTSDLGISIVSVGINMKLGGGPSK